MMSGFIYAVECGQRVKVGFSVQPALRFNKISSDAPFPCRLLGFWAGTRADEASIHDAFHLNRVHGEWFARSEGLLDFIAANTLPILSRSRTPENDIRTFRKARKWSQQRLAEELGVNTSTVWRWEKDGAGVNGVVQQAILRLAEQHPAPERVS